MRESDYVDGAVSLWVGQARSEAALAAYADYDNSSSAGSTLAGDFGTGRYDHDFLEAETVAPTRSLSTLLRGCSYDAIIIPKVIELCGDVLPEEVNAFVLLYNFQYHGSPGTRSNSNGPVQLRYMGSIQVEMPWPN